MRVAVLLTTALFLLNALGMLLFQRHVRSDPFYSGTLAFRKFLLEPLSVALVVFALGVWLGLLFLRNRSRPLTDWQKAGIVAILLATLYGFILTAFLW